MSDKRRARVEQRKYIRLSAIARVEYAIIGAENLSGRSATKNMSRDGVRFTVAEKLKKGTLLDLKIDAGKGGGLIAARVKTVWCKRLGKNPSFDIGALFIKIDPADKDKLLDYAYRSWLKSARQEHRNA